MISAGIVHNLTELFSGMSIVTFMCILTGMMLIAVEFFQPSYRFPTVSGCLLVLLGITVRMLSGGTVLMLFFMVLFCLVPLLAAHMLMLVTQKKAWLTQSLALKLEREGEEETGLTFLLGREGIAVTDIDDGGHIAIDNVNFFVTSEIPVPKGSAVRVVHVAGDNIRVLPMYEDNE